MPQLELQSTRSAKTDYMAVIDGEITDSSLNPEDSIVRRSGAEDVVAGILEGGSDSIQYNGQVVDFKAQGATIEKRVDGTEVSALELQADTKQRPVSGPIATELNVSTSVGSLTAKVSWFNPHPHEIYFDGKVFVTGKGMESETPGDVRLMGSKESAVETVSFSFDGLLDKEVTVSAGKLEQDVTVDVVSIDKQIPKGADALVFSTGVGVVSYVIKKLTGE